MLTQENYNASAGQFFNYEVRCNNPECFSFNFVYGDVQAETIYPYILCGSCGDQILNLKKEGSDWVVIQEARAFFQEIGML
jgi:hypothetical protein